jgi:prephenate dehydrogenase
LLPEACELYCVHFSACSCCIKFISPSLLKQAGFSAGSFKDLTRVAKLNEDMWTELFLMNRGPLVDEIEHIIARLTEYRDAIANNDAQRLHDLLKEGRELKELSNNSK